MKLSTAIQCRPVSRRVRGWTLSRPISSNHPRPRNSSPFSTIPPPPPRNNGARRPLRLVRPVIYLSLLSSGYCTGQHIQTTILPPPLPVPYTLEDGLLREELQESADELPIVLALREQWQRWTEYEIDGGEAGTDHERTFLTRGICGARGVAVQRYFWNEEERRAISVVYLGGGLVGFPRVVHGGAIVTVMQEVMGAAAEGGNLMKGEESGSGSGSGRADGEFVVDYMRPVTAQGFHVVRAQVDGIHDHVVQATVEDGTGVVCAIGKAWFKVPAKDESVATVVVGLPVVAKEVLYRIGELGGGGYS